MSEQRSTSFRGNRSHLVARDISESLGKLPPQVPQVEADILGAIIQWGASDAPSIALAILVADDFYTEQHKEIYTAIKNLTDNNHPIKLTSVVHELKRMGKIEVVGGATYVAELSSAGGNMIHERDCYVVKEYSIKRQLIQMASQIHHDAYEDTTDALDLLVVADRCLQAISGTLASSSMIKIQDALVLMAKEIQARATTKAGLTGVPSGLLAIDRITHGWQNTDLIIIAARPGMGKTALILSILKNAAVQFGIPVGIVSLEMAAIQLAQRMASMESGITLQDIRGKQFNEQDWHQLSAKTAKLSQAPIFVDDSATMSISVFRSKARIMVKEKGVKMIVVDYLQLMKGEREGNREQEISSITRGLKSIAKELNIPIIALSQLSRKVEDRGGMKIPQLADLRESGSIEQDADVIIFLWRPEYYKFTGDKEGTFCQGVTACLFTKHRNGSLQDAYIKFVPKSTEFVELEHVYTHQYNGSGTIAKADRELPPPDQTHESTKDETDDLPF